MPKLVDHAARRTEIAAAVHRIAAERGLGAASLREVAAEAGWSLGALRHYFASREALLEFAARDEARRGLERMTSALAGNGAPRELLRRMLLEALPIDAERASECRVRFAFAVAADRSPVLAAERERAHAERLAEVTARLDGLTRFGQSPERTARLLWAAVDGIALHGVGAPAQMTPARQRAALDEQLDLLLSGTGTASSAAAPLKWG